MDIKVVWAAIQPLLTQLLQSPQFQALLQKILADITAKIDAGVHPTVATDQAVGQIGAAALLHLTGNPIATLLSNLKPPTDTTGKAFP